MTGVLLYLRHPALALRDCNHCLRVLYDEKKGTPCQSRGGGERLRDRSCPPPCRTPQGCPKGTPEAPRALNASNAEAYEHYLECRAVGQFPDDAIVRRNAALIRMAEEQHAEGRRLQFESLIQLTLHAALR